MNESITCEEVLHLARHLHACMDEVVKSLQLLAAGADGVVLSARSAGAFRTLADYIEWPPSMAATKAGITLRRAADQIDPPTVPAEPDLTTRAGWEATMAALGDVEWEDMPIPSCREQRVGLLAAWKIADLSGHDKDAVLLAQVFTASLADEV